MIRTLSSNCVLVVAIVQLLLVSAVSAADDQSDWIQLFNGKDLSNWKVKIRGHELGDNYKDTFTVKDGVIKISCDKYENFGEKFGHLFYKTPFSHYILRVEYRFLGDQTPGGPGWAYRNSGVMIHGQTPESMKKDQDFPDSIEVQLLGGKGEGERPTANLCTPGTHVVKDGELLKRHCTNSQSKTYHGDQWVTVEIEVRGSESIKHIIDGETVLEYSQPQLNDGTILESGTISLQSESHPVEFRKVELKKLNSDIEDAPAKTISLFNGENLEGWYADIPDADKNPDIKPSFIVREGKLVSMGVPRGHLITKKSYNDYRLEVQYRFAGEPGNCGVLVHTDGKRPRVLYEMFPASLEVQMQHKAAGDFWCIHEDIKVPGMESRRDGPKENWGGKQGQSRHIRNLTDGSEKPLGEWNTMIIECLDDKIRVWVNGDLVNDGYECTATQGQISIQAEGAEVEFRKLALTPIKKLTAAKDLSIPTVGNAAKDTPKIKVLLIDGQNNHDWKRCSPVMIETLEATGRFSIERATVAKEDVADFSPDFTAYDVVLSNYHGQPWPDKTKAAFVKYVEEGGSLVVVHAADNAFPKWKEYNLMIGLGGWEGRNEKDGPYVYWKDGEIIRDDSPGRGGSHGRPWEYKVVVREKDHPITRGLPTEFLQAKEELYDRLRGPAENMTILATAFAKGGSERHEPVLMTITYGKGRIFHTVMGHDHKSMQGVAFQETLIRGTEWAATGEVTFPPVTSEILPVDRAASRDPKDIKRTH